MATSRLTLEAGKAYLYSGSEGLYQVLTGQTTELSLGSSVPVSGSLLSSGSIFLKNQAAAPTPGAAEAVLYARAGTLYFKNSGGSETAVGGGGVSDGDKGDITVSTSGATWTIDNLAVTTAKIADSAVTYAKIQNVSATDKILGRSTAGAGVVEEIACTAAGRALIDDADASAQRTTLGLGSLSTLSTVSTSDLSNSAVTYAKIQDVSATDKILGRSTAGAGAVEEIACTAAGRALLDDADASAQRTTLGLGTLSTVSSVATANIDNDAVINSKLANMADGTIKGRAVGAGTGDPADLTATQATAILNEFTSVLKGLAPASGGGTTNFLRADGTWAAPAGGGSSVVTGTFNDTGAKFITTASVSIAGNRGFSYAANSAGTDVFFFVSGSMAGGLNSTALLGGRAVVSGNFTTHGDLAINGSNITSVRSSFNILNSAVTTINFAGGGTDISIGSDQSGNTYIKHNLQVSGALYYGDELYAAGGVADKSDTTLVADIAGYRYVRFSNFSVTKTCNIPAASAAKNRVITILNDDDASVVTITSAGGNIVGNGNTDTTYDLQAKRWIEVVSDGIAWLIVCGGQLPSQNL